MSKPVNIKEIISNLVQILNLNKFTKVTPEMFRLAKYDDQRAAKTFLTLVYEILLWKTWQKSDLQNDKQRFMLIVLYARYIRYSRMNQLSKGLSGELSSRELLIFFGWIVVELNFMKSLQNSAESRVCNNLVNDFVNGESLQELSKLEIADEKTSNCLLTDAHKLLYINKKVDLTYRHIRTKMKHLTRLIQKCYSTDTSKLLSELNKNSHSVNFRTLCASDYIFQSNPKLQKKLIDSICESNTLLRLHLSWMKGEHVFWQWMSSVVDEADKITTTTPLTTAIAANDVSSSAFVNLKMHMLLENVELSGHDMDNTGHIIGPKFTFECKRFQDLMAVLLSKPLYDTTQETTEYYESIRELLNAYMDRTKRKITEMKERNRALLGQIQQSSGLDYFVQLPVPRR